MILDDRYPVLETLEEREGVTLYRVEGGVVFFFQVRTPEDKERFYRYRAAIKRLEELGLVEAVVSAKPGRYYAFFPERPLARKVPPRAALEALAPLGFGPEHLAMAEEGVAYLSPWPLGSARRALARGPSRPRPGFLKAVPFGKQLGVAPGLLLFLLGLWLFFPRGLPLLQSPGVRCAEPGGQDRPGGLSPLEGYGAQAGGGGGERPGQAQGGGAGPGASTGNPP